MYVYIYNYVRVYIYTYMYWCIEMWHCALSLSTGSWTTSSPTEVWSIGRPNADCKTRFVSDSFDCMQCLPSQDNFVFNYYTTVLVLVCNIKTVYTVWTHTILSAINKYMCTWMKMMKAWKGGKGGIMWNQCILGFCICLWILMDRLTLRLSFLTSTCLA